MMRHQPHAQVALPRHQLDMRLGRTRDELHAVAKRTNLSSSGNQILVVQHVDSHFVD
jgi:hypothetical protein